MNTVTRACGTCGVEFTRRANQVDKSRSPGLYCSVGCGVTASNRARKGHHTHRGVFGEANPNWRGGISRDNCHYTRLFASRHPEKVRAHAIVRSAIGRGELVQRPCVLCGSTDRIHAHHTDYTQPLLVTWLCKPCHIQEHVRLSRGAT